MEKCTAKKTRSQDFSKEKGHGYTVQEPEKMGTQAEAKGAHIPPAVHLPVESKTIVKRTRCNCFGSGFNLKLGICLHFQARFYTTLAAPHVQVMLLGLVSFLEVGLTLKIIFWPRILYLKTRHALSVT